MKGARYDVAVIGAGHNGLICAAYLSRAGLKVVVLESRHETGGGLCTEEFGGFKFNLHATYHLMAEIMPPYKDFELWKYNVKFIYPDVQCAYLNTGDTPLIFYRDPKKTADFLRKVSPPDADKYLEMYSDFADMSDNVLIPLTYVPPLPPVEQFQAMEKSTVPAGKKVAEISEMTAVDVVGRYGFSDRVNAAILNLFTMWGISPFESLGYLVPLYVYRMTNAALCAGGSHRLSSALCKVVIGAGGEIYERARVAGVSLTNGRTSGVVLDDGTEVAAGCVVSTVDPHQSFVKFFEGREVPGDLTESARAWEWEKQTFFGMHLGLKEPPVYSASASSPDVNNALICFLGVNGMDDLLASIKEVEAGRLLSGLHGHVTCTSIFDPVQAPPGFHTARWESLVPFGCDWDALQKEYAARCMTLWKEYAPNIAPVHTYVYPPTYIEKKIINMVKGSFKHGAYVPLQMGYFRPNDQCSGVRTPIEGFYTSGASTYPGGMIIGGPGYVGAHVIMEDLGVKKTWGDPDYVRTAREKGLIE